MSCSTLSNLGRAAVSVAFLFVKTSMVVAFDEPAQAKARFNCGPTVELLGISEHPSKGKKWWGPDGTELSSPPYEESGVDVFPQPGETAVELAIRIDNWPVDSMSPDWIALIDIEPSISVTSRWTADRR